jgi:hypothetical protein
MEGKEMFSYVSNEWTSKCTRYAESYLKAVYTYVYVCPVLFSAFVDKPQNLNARIAVCSYS